MRASEFACAHPKKPLHEVKKSLHASAFTFSPIQTIEARKKQRITANNKRENRSRINYQYAVGDQILIKVELKGKFAGDPCEGPYRVTSVNPANGTIRYQKGAVEDVINIRNVTPCHT